MSIFSNYNDNRIHTEPRVDVVLKLEASDNQECGQIIVRVSVDKEAVNAGTAAVDEAVQNIKDKLHGDKLSASKSFGIVVAQLQVLHDIINQAAKVELFNNKHCLLS